MSKAKLSNKTAAKFSISIRTIKDILYFSHLNNKIQSQTSKPACQIIIRKIFFLPSSFFF